MFNYICPSSSYRKLTDEENANVFLQSTFDHGFNRYMTVELFYNTNRSVIGAGKGMSVGD